jgi:hypothetical protein
MEGRNVRAYYHTSQSTVNKNDDFKLEVLQYHPIRTPVRTILACIIHKQNQCVNPFSQNHPFG